MIYRFLKGAIGDFSCFAENIVGGRSYFVPFSTRENCDSGEYIKSRYFSDRIRMLNGDWDFWFFPDGPQAEEQFDSENTDFKTIKVPCSWENAGFLDKNYIHGYDFKLSPYKVPEGKKKGNAYGIYRKKFQVNDFSRNYLLTFLQVSGTFEVQINGKYCGFSALNSAEFDITELLVPGDNELVVTVRRWTMASYLYGSERFSATGIIGDVFLTVQNPNCLDDYSFKCSEMDGKYAAKLDMRFKTDGNGASVAVELLLDGETVSENTVEIDESGRVEIEYNDEYKPFTSETPTLYDAYITIIENENVTECTHIKLGFGALTELEGAYSWCGQPLKIRGVNYNATISATGEDMTLADYEKDFELLKDFGFNAVQPTYTLDPAVVTLAAMKGLYVVSGVGFCTAGLKKLGNKKRDIVAMDTKFAQPIELLAKFTVERFKAAPAVMMYNFGDENGSAANVSAAINVMKTITDRPIMAANLAGEIGPTAVSSIFYPRVDELIDEINRVSAVVPVYMSEYALSAGMGSANMGEFYDIIENTACCVGGSVSYFIDDVYGGVGDTDCGLFSVDRKPYAGALNYRFVNRPIKCRLLSPEKMEVYNSQYFCDTSDVEIRLVSVKNGRPESKVNINVNIPARTAREVDVFVERAAGEVYLNVECRQKSADKLLSVEQHTVNTELQTIVPFKGGKINVFEDSNFIKIRTGGNEVRFSKYTGTIIGYTLMDKEILYAAPTRNGGMCFNAQLTKPFVRNILNKKLKVKYEAEEVSVQNITESSADVIVETSVKFKKKPAFLIQDKYTVFSNGVIEVFSVLNAYKHCPENLDCFGKQLRLHPGFESITYYGRGSGDNYIDLCSHTCMGLYKSTATAMGSACAFGQECGNRTDVHYAVVKDKSGDGLMLSALMSPLQLRVGVNSDEELAKSYKKKKPVAKSGVYIDVDAFVSGYGSGGSELPMAKYTVKSGEHVLHFMVVPVYGGAKEAI